MGESGLGTSARLRDACLSRRYRRIAGDGCAGGIEGILTAPTFMVCSGTAGPTPTGSTPSGSTGFSGSMTAYTGTQTATIGVLATFFVIAIVVVCALVVVVVILFL